MASSNRPGFVSRTCAQTSSPSVLAHPILLKKWFIPQTRYCISLRRQGQRRRLRQRAKRAAS